MLRRFLLLLSILLALFTTTTLHAAERPNILFVFSDDHAYQAISAYGSKINETPNIDRLAKEGMRFDRCTVTNSICGPSRAVILTGKHSHLNGFRRNGNRFDMTQQTFPKLLQKAGYQTAVIGKWHLGTEPTGFDYYHILQGQGPYYNPVMLTGGMEKVPHVGYTTDVITDLTLDWLKNKRDGEKPFMLMYQHKAPHRTWMPGPDHLNMFDGETIPEPETLFDDYKNRASVLAKQTMEIDRHMHFYYDLKVPVRKDIDLQPNNYLRAAERWYETNFTPEQKAAWDKAYGPKNEAFYERYKEGMTNEELVKWKYQRYIKDYLRSIASVDDNLGRVLDYLDEAGLADNTVVIYSSDQGFYLGEHGWYDKRWMYEESFRTPFVVRWPGVIEEGSVNTDLTQNLDFAQTFLEIAGVDAPADMQGASLVPLMKGETPDDWRKSLYYHYYEGGGHGVPVHCGVATDRYKLIHYYQANEWDLLDREKDPLEMRSFYDDPEYADVRAKLEAELKRLQKKYGVQMK